VLANTEVHWEALEHNLRIALGLASQIDEAYRLSGPKVRRWFNQAIFESVHVDVEREITHVELAQPFKLLLDQDLLAKLKNELKNPGPSAGRGSNMDLLVEVMGRYLNPCDQGERLRSLLEWCYLGTLTRFREPESGFAEDLNLRRWPNWSSAMPTATEVPPN